MQFSDQDIHKILATIDPDEIPDPEQIKSIREVAENAAVHAEAALMVWELRRSEVFSIQFLPPLFSHLVQESGDIVLVVPIGVGKRCCACCWALQSFVKANDEEASFIAFDAPGTHATFFQWLPPIGTPEWLLLELRDHFVTSLRSNLLLPSRTRHSSSASSDASSVVGLLLADPANEFQPFQH